MHSSDYPSHSQPPQPPRKRQRHGWRLVRNILLGIAGAFVLLIVLVSVFDHPKTAASPGAVPSISAPVSVPASSAPAASTAPPSTAATAPVTVGRFAGTGDYSSPPFTLSGSPVTVTYSYSGNILAGETSGDNFMAGLSSSGDSLQIVNTIAVSGGSTTTLYPNTSFGGSTSYHLSVTATGSWSFTITETP